MTTGTMSLDASYTQATDCGGSNPAFWFGLRSGKTWDGVDQQPGVRPLVDHPYTMYGYREKSILLEWGWKHSPNLPWRSGHYLSCGFQPPKPTLSWGASNDYRLLSRMKNDIQGSDFNFSVFLGEGHQTLKLIGDTALKLGKALRQAKRGNLAAAAKTLTGAPPRKPIKPYNEAASNWLQLQYGWMPLISDAHEGAVTLAHRLETPLQKTYRHSGKISTRIPYRANGQLGWGKNERTITKQIICTMSEDWGISIPALVGLQDPELVAWELVPFSFVADWFIPIGNWLDARAFASKLKGHFCTTLKDTWEWYGLRPGISGTGDYRFRYSYDGTLGRRESTLTRTISDTVDVPLPEVKPLAKVASWQHCANAVALLVGMKTHLEL